MINIVLNQPEIPYNTGNIGRTCLLTNSRLHLIRPFPFKLDDKSLKRAGLDYWDEVDVIVHDSFEEFYKTVDSEIYFATTKTDKKYTDIEFKDGNYIVFGSESCGFTEDVLEYAEGKMITIPMVHSSERSLNLSNSVAIVLYEVLRQINFVNL